MSDFVDKKSKKKKNLNCEEELSYQQPKKKKKIKSAPYVEEENPVPEEHEDNHLEEYTEEQHEKVNTEEDNYEWSKEEYLELIRRMEIQLPKDDTKSFTSRVEKLDWDKIQFGSHSVDECFEKWRIIRSKVRHYRLLGEVLQDGRTWAEKPWAASLNKKKGRHPEQPARPLSSFMLFYMDKKNKIIRRHPELKLTDISRVIGEKYKTLSDEKKAYYLEKAKLMQDEYKLNLSKFYKKYPEMMRVTKKQSAKNNKPLPPLKLYLKEKLQKHQQDEDFDQNGYIEKYKEMWKNLSVKKKAWWIRLAKEEEEKYLDQLNADLLYKGEARSPAKLKSVISKEENAILDRLAGKPEKPPNSAYSLFSRLMLQDKDQNYVEGEPKNRMKEIAKMWKEVPINQKKTYAEKVQHMHDTYKLEFANYLEGLPEDKKAEELAKLKPKKNPAKSRQKAVKKGSTSAGPSRLDLFKNEPEKPPVSVSDVSYPDSPFPKPLLCLHDMLYSRNNHDCEVGNSVSSNG